VQYSCGEIAKKRIFWDLLKLIHLYSSKYPHINSGVLNLTAFYDGENSKFPAENQSLNGYFQEYRCKERAGLRFNFVFVRLRRVYKKANENFKGS